MPIFRTGLHFLFADFMQILHFAVQGSLFFLQGQTYIPDPCCFLYLWKFVFVLWPCFVTIQSFWHWTRALNNNASIMTCISQSKLLHNKCMINFPTEQQQHLRNKGLFDIWNQNLCQKWTMFKTTSNNSLQNPIPPPPHTPPTHTQLHTTSLSLFVIVF